MPSSSFFQRSSTTLVSALLLTSTVSGAALNRRGLPFNQNYQLDTEYSGSSFFDGFNFFTAADPTHGFTYYVGQSDAQSAGLISTGSSAIMRADNTTVYPVPPSEASYSDVYGIGRKSIRIESQKSWTHGLIIADIKHMPSSAVDGCGTWPAFWTLGSGTWPYNGEIDILEGANDQTQVFSAGHTGDATETRQCETSNPGGSGHLNYDNCDLFTTSPFGGSTNPTGCTITDTDPNNYGQSFNDNQGGVYAMEWTSSSINTYFFPRNAIPRDISLGFPDPTGWTPFAVFGGNSLCDIDSNFNDMRIIFDMTFCGDFGSATWGTTCAAKTGVDACYQYVPTNPSAFTETYWDISSVKVFKLRGSTASSTTSSSTTTSATTSSSSSSTTTTSSCTSSHTSSSSSPAAPTSSSTSSYARSSSSSSASPTTSSTSSWTSTTSSSASVAATSSSSSTWTSSSPTVPTSSLWTSSSSTSGLWSSSASSTPVIAVSTTTSSWTPVSLTSKTTWSSTSSSTTLSNYWGDWPSTTSAAVDPASTTASSTWADWPSSSTPVSASSTDPASFTWSDWDPKSSSTSAATTSWADWSAASSTSPKPAVATSTSTASISWSDWADPSSPTPVAVSSTSSVSWADWASASASASQPVSATTTVVVIPTPSGSSGWPVEATSAVNAGVAAASASASPSAGWGNSYSNSNGTTTTQPWVAAYTGAGSRASFSIAGAIIAAAAGVLALL